MIVSDQIRFQTLVRFYFGQSDNLKIKAIHRAYLDFNRTLPLNGASQQDRDRIKSKAVKFIFISLSALIADESSQKQFDDDLENIISSLCEFWPELSIGQSQKWINMTLKYWLILGEAKVPNVELNAAFFHIPIDSIIQKRIFPNTTQKPWSKINDYMDYFNYQRHYREMIMPISSLCPILWEIKEFNSPKFNTLAV